MPIIENSHGHRFLRTRHGTYPVNNGDPQNEVEEGDEDGHDYYADWCDRKAEESA